MTPTTLARPYAKAAFGYADEHDLLADWSRMLALLEAVAAQERVAAKLASPRLSAEQLAAVLIDLCGDALDPPMRNFIRTLAGHKRLVLLGEIAAQFEQLKADRERSLDVEIASSRELTERQRAQLLDWLGGRFGRSIELHTRVDAKLLGGVVIRAGDTVIDGSIRGRLARLTEALH